MQNKLHLLLYIFHHCSLWSWRSSVFDKSYHLKCRCRNNQILWIYHQDEWTVLLLVVIWHAIVSNHCTRYITRAKYLQPRRALKGVHTLTRHWQVYIKWAENLWSPGQLISLFICLTPIHCTPTSNLKMFQPYRESPSCRQRTYNSNFSFIDLIFWFEHWTHPSVVPDIFLQSDQAYHSYSNFSGCFFSIQMHSRYSRRQQ